MPKWDWDENEDLSGVPSGWVRTVSADGTATWQAPTASPGGSLPFPAQAGNGSPLPVSLDPTGNDTTPTGKGSLYVDLAGGALYLAVGLTSSDWCLVSGFQSFGGASGVQNNGSTVYVMAKTNGSVVLTDVPSDVSSDFFNGLSWNAGAANGEQTLTVKTGDTGQFSGTLQDAKGVMTSPGGIIFPIADPHVAGAWWDNAGVLTKSAG